MLTLTDISKSYGKLKVLEQVDLHINHSEILAIVGPSGAGKTTLLQIAGTLERPDSGEIRWEGTDLTRLSDKAISEFRNKNMGFVFQFHQLLPEFTARENISLPALIGGASRREANMRADQLLERLGLSERALHKPAELSGGEKQRVAIARSLINRPSVVFADEPTGSLDSGNRNEILTLISNLREETGTAFVIVTHDPELASIADKTIHILDGHIAREV